MISERVEQAEGPIPTRASFNVGRFDDGSGPKVRVRYDVTGDYAADKIWIDYGDYSEQWIALDPDIADEFCVVVKKSAEAITALKARGL